MALVRLARHAMATRFEIVLCGENAVSLRAAGEEALDEVDRLERQLSLFKPTSEIAHVNARAAREAVRVSPAVFKLLEHARQITLETEGAFDITIAPLVKCWGFMGGTGRWPKADDLVAARGIVGMQWVHLNPSQYTVQFQREGVMLDLGAIGKGYAIEQAVELLREAGVTSALLHGGTSTIYGLGRPPEGDSWKIEIPSPRAPEPKPSTQLWPTVNTQGHEAIAQSESVNMGANLAEPFATVELRDASLSVSAVWGKSFQAQGKRLGHIIDPRSGEPAQNAVLAAVVLPSATETDALSTALLTLGPGQHDRIARLRAGIRTLVAAEGTEDLLVKSQGIELNSRFENLRRDS